MAFLVGENHYIGFLVGTPSLPTTGLITSNFSVDILTLDGSPITPLSVSFSIVELNSGYYYAQYVPASAGKYVCAFSNVINDFGTIDVADISDVAPTTADVVSYVRLTQDTGGPNALRPSLIHSRFSLGDERISSYMLMVFSTSDWMVGRTDTHYAHAQTGLDIHGNWQATPLIVEPGTYHIIIRDNFGKTQIVKPNLVVS